MLLGRRVLGILALAVLLYQQPFMVRRKEKVVPLHLAVSGAVSAAGPSWPSAVEVASRSLLTPLEYVKAQKATNSSKRSLSAAYERTEGRFSRIVDTNTSAAAKMAAASAYPRSDSLVNYPVVGSYLLTAGTAVAPLVPGAELLVLLGCACLFFGCEGMSAQPEFLCVLALAALGLYAIRSARAAAEEQPKAPRRRRTAKQRARDRAERLSDETAGTHAHAD